MKNAASQYLYSVFRQAAQELRQLGQKAAQGIAGTPLPKVLVVLIALFLLITLIPLIISLFIAIVLLRLFLSIFSLDKKRNKYKTIKSVYLEQGQDRR